VQSSNRCHHCPGPIDVPLEVLETVVDDRIKAQQA
jgi:hypothetical protein